MQCRYPYPGTDFNRMVTRPKRHDLADTLVAEYARQLHGPVAMLQVPIRMAYAAR
jgi:hypothetical protein